MRYITTIIFALFYLSISAQTDDSSYVTITTTDGTVIVGKILESDESQMIIRTDFGKAEVLMDKIKSVAYQSKQSVTDTGTAYADLGNNNYSASHYLLSNSAFGLQKGESYYENTYLLWNTYAIGFNDNFSLNVSGEIISPLFSRSLPVIAISPKISLPLKNIGAIAISSTLFSFPDSGTQYGGFINAGITLGNKLNNITFNGAIGWGSEFDLNQLHPFSVSAMVKLSNNLSLVSENWLFDGDSFTEGAFSLNLRYHFKNNKSSITFGLWRPTEDTGPLLAIPFAAGIIGI